MNARRRPVRVLAAGVVAAATVLTAAGAEAQDGTDPTPPPEDLQTPGVYIQEDLAAPTVTPVPTGIPLFVGAGTTTPGPVGVGSAAELATVAPGAGPDVAAAVRHFFDHGGTAAQVLLTGGGEPPSLAAALGTLTPGLEADLLVVPSLGGLDGAEHISVATALIAAAATVEAMALLDLPTSLVQQAAQDPAGGITALVALADQLRSATPSPSHGALYSSPIVDDTGATVPASVAAAGVIAVADAETGPWDPPAGVEYPVGGTPLLPADEQVSATLGPEGINPLRVVPGYGTVIWGARTLAMDSTDTYLGVARLLGTIERSATSFLQGFTSAPDTGPTWEAVDQGLSAYLTVLWQEGALFGSTAADAFTVDVGQGTTMTAQDVLDGRLIVELSVVPTEPEEPVRLTLTQQVAPSG